MCDSGEWCRSLIPTYQLCIVGRQPANDQMADDSSGREQSKREGEEGSGGKEGGSEDAESDSTKSTRTQVYTDYIHILSTVLL